MQNDKELIEEFLKERTEVSFNKIYAANCNLLYRLTVSLCTNKENAEEVYQETWLRTVKNLANFKYKSSLSTWLCGILINCVKEFHKKHNKVIETNENTFFETNVDRKLDIKQALSFLPTGYREILLLHDLEGYKHNEIAEILGINEGTSKSQLHHVRKTIKQFLN